jgi:tetratricopeptide (TPR) repeat protein
MDDYAVKAKEASDRSVQLAPEDSDVISKLGDYYYYAHRDYARANEQYQRLAEQRPNDAVVFSSLGLIQRRQGRWAESLDNLRRATELDVANDAYLGNLISSLQAGRRYDELAAAWRRRLALKPDDIETGYQLALTSFEARGSTKEVEDFLANLTPEETNSPRGISIRADWASDIGDTAEFVRLTRVQPYLVDSSLSHWEQDLLAASALDFSGDHAGAIARLGHIPGDLDDAQKREPKNPRLWLLRARVDLIFGRNADAESAADRCTQLIPESTDALEGPLYASLCVFVYDQAGDKDRALSEYTRLLRDPGAIMNVYSLKHDPASKLHGDPRFEALLNDPANNAPLF